MFLLQKEVSLAKRRRPDRWLDVGQERRIAPILEAVRGLRAGRF